MKEEQSLWADLQTIDRKYSQRLWIAEKPGVLRTIATIFAHSGDSWLIGALLGFLLAFGPAEWKPGVLFTLVVILIAAVIVFIIKFTVRRRRPPGEWGQIYRRTDPHSFPSGHAARAMLLVVLAFALCPLWFGLIALVWAPLVMLARVAMGLHYLSDVIVGALLGLGIGLFSWWVIPQFLSHV